MKNCNKRRTNIGLKSEQRKVIERVIKEVYKKNKKGVLIADRVGAGKSFEALGIIAKIVRRKRKKSSLILCPRYLVSEWIKPECNRYTENIICTKESCKQRGSSGCIIAHIKKYIENNDIQRLKREDIKKFIEHNFKKRSFKDYLNDLGHIYKYIYCNFDELKKDSATLRYFLNSKEITSYNELDNCINVLSLGKIKGIIKKRKLSILVIDEIQHLKGAGKRYYKVDKLIKIEKPFRIFLSGTPFETNIPIEAYRILRLLEVSGKKDDPPQDPPSKSKSENNHNCINKLYNIYYCLNYLNNLSTRLQKEKNADAKKLAKYLIKIYITADLKHDMFTGNDNNSLDSKFDKCDFENKNNDNNLSEIKKALPTKKEYGLDELFREYIVRQRPSKQKNSKSDDVTCFNNDNQIKIKNDEIDQLIYLLGEYYYRKKDTEDKSTLENLFRLTSVYRFSKKKSYNILEKIRNHIPQELLDDIKNRIRNNKHPKLNKAIETIINEVSDTSKDPLGERIIIFVRHQDMARELRDRLNVELVKSISIRTNKLKPKKGIITKKGVQRLKKYLGLLYKKRKCIINIQDTEKQIEINIDSKKIRSIYGPSTYHFNFAEIFHIPKNKNSNRHIKDIKEYFTNNEYIFPRVLIFVKKGTNGINIQHDCRKLLHYNLDFNPGVIEQREGRINRQGRKEGNLWIKTLILENSYDEEVLARASLRMRLKDLIGGYIEFWGEKNIEALADKILDDKVKNIDVTKFINNINNHIDTIQKRLNLKDIWHICNGKNKKINKKVTFKYLKEYKLVV